MVEGGYGRLFKERKIMSKNVFLNGLSFVALVFGVHQLVTEDNIWLHVMWTALTILNAGFMIERLKERK